jgi:flavodoxin I
MSILIIYDSVFGNTEKIAQAIGAALRSQEKIETLRVNDVKPVQLAGLKLLIVGSPTRQFRPTAAMTSFLKGIPGSGLKGVKVAAFDTRITQSKIDGTPVLAFFVRIFGYAAGPMAKILQKKGGELVAPPEGFFVEGTEGPLKDGELDRAADWTRYIITG